MVSLKAWQVRLFKKKRVTLKILVFRFIKSFPFSNFVAGMTTWIHMHKFKNSAIWKKSSHLLRVNKRYLIYRYELIPFYLFYWRQKYSEDFKLQHQIKYRQTRIVHSNVKLVFQYGRTKLLIVFKTINIDLVYFASKLGIERNAWNNYNLFNQNELSTK